METLVNETSANFINSCNIDLSDLTKSGKLLLFCGDKFETPDIDTIYEVYISGHAFNQAFNRVGYRQIDYNEIVSIITKILECTPITILDTPQESNRHITFDVFNSNAVDKNNIIQIACIVGAVNPTKIISTVQQNHKITMTCTIVVKTIIELSTPQFSKTDLINNAIHIPISVNDFIDLDENNFDIKCDIPIVNKLIMSNISAYRVLDKNNKGIKIYPYVEFFQVLEDANIINYPKQLDISTTLNKHSDIYIFENVHELLTSNIIAAKDYINLHNYIYRGGKYVNRYEFSNIQKKHLACNLLPSTSKYKTPVDVVCDFLLTLNFNPHLKPLRI